MKQFRKCIFETNSSSTHAITIANNSSDDFKFNLSGDLVFDVGEFGWDFSRYQTIRDRANYLFTGILCQNLCDEYLPKIKETLSKWGVNAIFPKLVKKESEYKKGEWYYELADDKRFYYVDHSYLLEDFLKTVCTDETLLMNYLFSDESFVATGNDNSDEELDVDTDAQNILFEYYKGN